MPLIQINLLEGRTPEQKKALLAAVTDAVHTSIGASLPSIRVWLHEFPASDYMAEGVWQPEKAAPPAS
jgi:4-oxalocrotonate tautomerase